MKLCDLEGLFRKVDAGHLRACRGHGFAQDAAAAADIEHVLAAQAREAIDIAEPQRVDFVERLEFALRVPPRVGELAEFLELKRIDVHAGTYFQAGRSEFTRWRDRHRAR